MSRNQDDDSSDWSGRGIVDELIRLEECILIIRCDGIGEQR